MKEIDLNGITFLRPVREGTSEWYYAMDYDNGDLYELQELYHFENGTSFEGNQLYLIHYPDGEVIEPVKGHQHSALGEPVYYDGKISFVRVDFSSEKIHILQFDCQSREVREIDEIPLSSVKDCYNLRLFEHPLTLTRQPNDGTLELIWPVKKTIQITEKESFFYLEGNRLYFNRWFEDPFFREETVIRDKDSGQILEVLSGDVHIMPNGEMWHLK